MRWGCDDNVSKVCKYWTDQAKPSAGVQREGERAGVNHVSASVSARQGNMPRPFKKDTRATRATRLNREGISPVAYAWISGHGGRVQRTFSDEREETAIITILYCYDIQWRHTLSEVKNAPSHFTRRHFKQPTAKCRNLTDDAPDTFVDV